MSVLVLHRRRARHPQAAACAACEVRAAALFGALSDDGLDRIHAPIACQALPADASIFPGGTAGESVYTIRSGIVRFERFTERGDRRIVRLAGRGALIGLEALLQRPYLDEAIACTPVQLCRIPRALIDALDDRPSPLPRELLQRMQRTLDEAEAWIADLCSGPARRRLLRLLERLAHHGRSDGTIWMPRRDEIGAMLDMTVETASRLVSRLRREAVLELCGPRSARLNEPLLRLALRTADAD